MSDDIVTRLRTKRMGIHTDELLEAADEIERLGRDAAIWRFIARGEHAAWSQCKQKCTCLEMQFLDIREANGHE